MRYWLSALVGAVGGIVGTAAMAAGIVWVQPLGGAIELVQLPGILTQHLFNYIDFNQPSYPNELALNSMVKLNGTSIVVVMPDTTYRYIQTSATP